MPLRFQPVLRLLSALFRSSSASSPASIRPSESSNLSNTSEEPASGPSDHSVSHSTISRAERQPMRTSQAGIDLIKSFEGLELEAYQDIAGIWTVGHGHAGPDVHPGLKISPEMAEVLLASDLRKFEDAVNRLVTAPLAQHEFDALVSLTYNIGASALSGSTVLRRLNTGDKAGAADAFPMWNKATVDGKLQEVAGLTRRRKAERAMFLGQ